MAIQKPVLVIGIGNPLRSDDAAGILVARRLKRSENDRLTVREQSGEAATLMDCWDGYDFVVLADALSSGAQPGTFHRIDGIKEAIPSRLSSASTHSLGVAEAIELARTLGRLPKKLFVYVIEGKNFQPGESLSPEVERSIEKVVRDILSLIS